MASTITPRALEHIPAAFAPQPITRLAMPSAAAPPAEPARPVDYRAQFLFLDTTHSPAHGLVLKALAVANASPGTQWMRGAPSGIESHISLATLEAPEIAVPQRPFEQPVPAAMAGFQAAAASPSFPLSLHTEVGYLDAPRVGPPQQTVAYLEVVDPSGALGRLRAVFHAASGIPSLSDAPMHLTLGNLELGTHLPTQVEADIAQHVRELGTWEARDLVLGGRHGANLAAHTLGSSSATSFYSKERLV